MSRSIEYEQGARVGCLLQLLWFAFVGWWLGAIWVAIAWLISLTIIGLPLGAAMLNYVPMVFALRGQRRVQVSPTGQVSAAPQTNVLIRALYFVLIGWWLSAIWLIVAYSLCMTIILLGGFDATPMVVSLKRT